MIPVYVTDPPTRPIVPQSMSSLVNAGPDDAVPAICAVCRRPTKLCKCPMPRPIPAPKGRP